MERGGSLPILNQQNIQQLRKEMIEPAYNFTSSNKKNNMLTLQNLNTLKKKEIYSSEFKNAAGLSTINKNV